MPAILKRTNRTVISICVILSVLQLSACSSSSENSVDKEAQNYIDGQGGTQGNGTGDVQGYNQDYNQGNDQGFNQIYGQNNNQNFDQNANQNNTQGNGWGNNQTYGQNGGQYQRNPSSALPPQQRILLVKNKLLTWATPVKREDDSPLLISEIGSYRIYYGTRRFDYQDMVEVKTAGPNRFDFSDFPKGIYYVVLTAVDTEGRESLYSRELLLLNFG